ncbi:MAG: hypothetical protein DRQ51_08810 [Gammaproteobacteria bacterium]|nr:MAG: hypothetical protein DRQ51_08810 [Gammaproteobacteria bacterium]
MQEILQTKFDDNIQKISKKRATGYSQKLNLVVLSGDTGIGKTTSIKEFANKKGFEFITIYCDESDAANLLVINLNNAINIIQTKEKRYGVVLLLDNINKADNKLLKIIAQYRNNTIHTSMRLAKTKNGKTSSLEYVNLEVHCDNIPENIFIVGEQRS